MPERRRTLVAYARDESFVPHSRAMLARLGYPIWSWRDWERAAERGEAPRPELLLVDEHRLPEVPASSGDEAPLPILLLTGRRGVEPGAGADDPRIRAALKRPAGLHDLFRLVQQLLEVTPRSTPRVATRLRATCRRRGQQWDAAVVSLSENGCLLRSSERLPLGTHVDLYFELPSRGPLELRAETAYQLVPDDLGLVFNALDAPSREAISRYVTDTIAARR